jgi:hypothetical protein
MVSQNAAKRFEPIMIGITKILAVKIYGGCASPFLTIKMAGWKSSCKRTRDDA